VVLAELDAAIALVSGDGEFRFNERQVLYVIRPKVMEQTGETLTAGTFGRIITDYENDNGEIALM